jgi:hypothetical protein
VCSLDIGQGCNRVGSLYVLRDLWLWVDSLSYVLGAVSIFLTGGGEESQFLHEALSQRALGLCTKVARTTCLLAG